MTYSKQPKIVVNTLQPRMFAIRVDIGISPAIVCRLIECVNEELAQLDGEGFIMSEPEIEMEGMTNVEAYYLYADTVCWEAFKARKASFMPDVEQSVREQYPGFNSHVVN